MLTPQDVRSVQFEKNLRGYRTEDVDRFLRRFHYEAFAIGDELPKQEGGGYV